MKKWFYVLVLEFKDISFQTIWNRSLRRLAFTQWIFFLCSMNIIKCIEIWSTSTNKIYQQMNSKSHIIRSKGRYTYVRLSVIWLDSRSQAASPPPLKGQGILYFDQIRSVKVIFSTWFSQNISSFIATKPIECIQACRNMNQIVQYYFTKWQSKCTKFGFWETKYAVHF